MKTATKNRRATCRLSAVICMLSATMVIAEDALPDPDGASADMSKPVQVFILMGQSNMLGFGKVAGGEGSLENAVKNKGMYPYLVDEDGNWTVRKDVRNVRVMNFRDYINDWMTINGLRNVGPEIGIGHYVGNELDAPVLILKSCIGNRSLGWDLLPPGSEPYEFGGKMLPGYRGTPDNPKGNGEKPDAGWYAGKQYDDDTDSAKQVLESLDKYYPGAKDYEIAGFLFWQGAKDGGSAAHAAYYEKNLVRFIKALRKDFNAPDALFVCATMGHGRKGGGGKAGQITDAQLAVDGKTGNYPEFKDNVATFYANPVSRGGSANGHYSRNAETYMNVGQGMGKAMAELLRKQGGRSSSGSAASASPAARARKARATTPGKVRALNKSLLNALVKLDMAGKLKGRGVNLTPAGGKCQIRSISVNHAITIRTSAGVKKVIPARSLKSADYGRLAYMMTQMLPGSGDAKAITAAYLEIADRMALAEVWYKKAGEASRQKMDVFFE